MCADHVRFHSCHPYIERLLTLQFTEPAASIFTYIAALPSPEPTSETEESGLSPGAIAGIVAGVLFAGAASAIIVCILVYCSRRQGKRQVVDDKKTESTIPTTVKSQ